MKKRYNQAEVTVLVDGVPMRDMGDGEHIEVADEGGEVEKTFGTDGPGVNIATRQGGYIKFKLREDSSSQPFIQNVRAVQENALSGDSGVVVQIISGTSVLHTLINSFCSVPGALTTGGGKMGASEFKFAGTQLIHNY
jgi:hypothetical protein